MGRRSWLLGRLAVAAQLQAGWALLLLVMCGVVVAVLLASQGDSATRTADEGGRRPWPAITTAGELVACRNSGRAERTYTDATGRPYPTKPALAPAVDVGPLATRPQNRPMVAAPTAYSVYRQPQPSHAWYQVWPRGPRHGWFMVGYDTDTRRATTWLSRRGVGVTEPPAADWFAPPAAGGKTAVPTVVVADLVGGLGDEAPLDYLLPTGDGIWRFRPADGQVRKVLSLPGAALAAWHRVDRPRDADGPTQVLVAARSIDAVALAGAPDWRSVSATLPREARDAPYLRLHPLADGGLAVLATPLLGGDFERLLRFDAQGTLVSDERLPAWLVPPRQPELEPNDWFMPLMASLAPAAVLSLCGPVDAGARLGVARAWRVGFPLSLLLVAPCVVATLRRQRRYRAPHTWAWVPAVAALGPLFWLGYLGHRRWDAAEGA